MTDMDANQPARVRASSHRLHEQIEWCSANLPNGSWRCFVSHFWFADAATAAYFALMWSEQIDQCS